jgi:hypothetical protein
MKKYNYLILVIVLFIILMSSCKKKPSISTDDIMPQLQNGLVGEYSFTGNAMDNSGNNNNGTVNGAKLTTDRFGNPNSAYSFDISNFIATSISQKNITAWSISLWFKTSLGGTIIRGARDCNGGYGIRLDMRADGDYKIVYGADDTRYIEGAITTNAYNDNQWHHLVGVWNGTGKTLIDQTQFVIYIGGVSAPQIHFSTVNPPPPLIGEGFHHSIPISGSAACAFGETFNCSSLTGDYVGQLDDIRIYNRVLTSEEITYLSVH